MKKKRSHFKVPFLFVSCSRLENEKKKTKNLNSPTEENDRESLDLHRGKKKIE